MSVKKAIKNNCEGCQECCQNKKIQSQGGQSNAVYGIGIFGAAFYFFPQAVGISGFALAILKSLVWPALLVFHALSLLKL